MGSDGFQFSILRLMPDPRRGEVVNIGLVVFLPGRLDVRILPSLHKVRVIDPRIDISQLYDLETQLQVLTDGVEETATRHAILRSLGDVQLSELGWFQVPAGREDAYENHVGRILRDLVSAPPRPVTEPRSTGLERTLRADFHRQHILGAGLQDIEHHKVVAHYPIAVDENLYADFAMRNSRWHITETIDLRSKPERIRSEKFKEAALKAITLDRAVKRLDDCLPLLVYAADENTLELTSSHINLLSDSADRLYNYLDNDDRAAYLEHMLGAAGTNLYAQ